MENREQREIKPFMLINDLSKIFHEELRDCAEREGLNECYRHLLFHLVHNDGASQLKLSKLARLKPPTVSVTLKKMEDEGYVERRQDPNDFRSVRVYLTDKGRQFNIASREVIEEIDEKAVAGFTNLEKKTLISLLSRVEENLTGESPMDRFMRRGKNI